MNSLKPCPESPNCVCSNETKETHHMEPWPIREKNLSDCLLKLRTLIENYPRTKIVEINQNYIHAEFRTKFFNFCDDVEFLIDEKNKLIYFRSASRVGYSDFGANKKRMLELEKIYLS